MTNKLKKRARALMAERGISYQAAVNALRADRAADATPYPNAPAPAPAAPLFVVEYNVAGDHEKHRAGPYSSAEVHGHLRDIEGYEGISNARIIPAESVS